MVKIAVRAPSSRRIAAIYTRVSGDEQRDKGMSLPSQEAAIRQFAIDQGYEIDERFIYRETHTGKEFWERRELSRMRQAVRDGEVVAVIAHNLDRLAREQAHIYILADEFERAGVAMLFATEEFDKTPEGKFHRSVKAFFAELEREHIRERTLRGKRAHAEAGHLHNGGVDLYGYRRDKALRKRSVDPIESATVRQIYELSAITGLGLRAISRRLNDAGTPPPAVDKYHYKAPNYVPCWHESTLRNILINPAYKGKPFAWRRAGQGERRGTRVVRPFEEWLPLDPATTPAIVSESLWQAAQDRLATNKGVAKRNESRPYLLRGHVFCGRCGRPMLCEPARDRRIYRCSSRNTAHGFCGGKSIPSDEVESWAWERITAILNDPALIAAELARLQEEGPDLLLARDLDAARHVLGKLTRQQENLVSRWSQGDNPDYLWELLKVEAEKIEVERKRIETTIADIERRRAQQQIDMDSLDQLYTYCAAVSENIVDATFDDKVLALDALDVHITGNGGSEPQDWHLVGSIPVGGVGVVSNSS